MNDWLDNYLRERLSDDSLPTEGITWEIFRNKTRFMILKRKLAILAGVVASAAAVLLFIMLISDSSSDINSIQTDVASFHPTNIEDNAKVLINVETPNEPKKHINNTAISPNVSESPGLISADSTYNNNHGEILLSDVIREVDNPIPSDSKNLEEFPELFDNETEASYHLNDIRVSPYVSFAGKNDNVYSYTPKSTGMEIPETTHYLPVSFGLDVSLRILPKLSITTGTSLAYYRSKLPVNGHISAQNVYYLGIPLRTDWTVWNSEYFSIWLGAGGKVDRLVYGKRGNSRVKDNSFNWSLISDAGIQFYILPDIGLFLEPEISYYFKPENPAIFTYRTNNPLMISFRTGIKFSF